MEKAYQIHAVPRNPEAEPRGHKRPKPKKQIFKKVALGMWADKKFLSLSRPPANAQSLWVWLLTGPRTTNIPGVVLGTPLVLAAELESAMGWAMEDTLRVFQEIIDAEMVEVGLGFIWLRNALRQKMNAPQSCNVVKSWSKAWQEIRECPLKARVQRQLRVWCRELGPGFEDASAEALGPEEETQQEEPSGKAPGKPFGKPSAEPYRIQEQETGTGTGDKQAGSETTLKGEGDDLTMADPPVINLDTGTWPDKDVRALLNRMRGVAEKRWANAPKYSTTDIGKCRDLLLQGADPEVMVKAWGSFVASRQKLRWVKFESFFDHYQTYENQVEHVQAEPDYGPVYVPPGLES